MLFEALERFVPWVGSCFTHKCYTQLKGLRGTNTLTYYEGNKEVTERKTTLAVDYTILILAA